MEINRLDWKWSVVQKFHHKRAFNLLQEKGNDKTREKKHVSKTS